MIFPSIPLFQSQNGLILTGNDEEYQVTFQEFQSQNGLILTLLSLLQVSTQASFQSQNGLILTSFMSCRIFFLSLF